MTDTTMMEQRVSEPLVLRLLNGMLNGCEFALKTERVLVVVSGSTDSELLSATEGLPADTIFLPFSENGVNFEIECFIDHEHRVLIRELYGDNTLETRVYLNTVIEVSGTRFALKRAGEEWSAEVLNAKNMTAKAKKNIFRSFKKSFVRVYVIVASMLLSFMFIGWMMYTSDSNYIRRLSTILDNKDLTFAEGRDKFIYILAEDHKRGIWVNQVIERGDYATHRIKVVNPEHEAERIYKWLADNHPKIHYFKIQLNRKRIPKLLLSKERATLSPAEVDRVKSELLHIMPYTKAIDIIFISDNSLIDEADQGLNSLGLSFTKLKNANYYSYNIAGELTDNEISRLKNFITAFYQQWGKEFVVFNLGLEKDPFRNKSYSYGESTYVKTNDVQWSFNEVKIKSENK